MPRRRRLVSAPPDWKIVGSSSLGPASQEITASLLDLWGIFWAAATSVNSSSREFFPSRIYDYTLGDFAHQHHQHCYTTDHNTTHQHLSSRICNALYALVHQNVALSIILIYKRRKIILFTQKVQKFTNMFSRFCRWNKIIDHLLNFYFKIYNKNKNIIT